MIAFIIGRILLVEAAALLVPMLTALICGEPLIPYLVTILLLIAAGMGLGIRKPKRTSVYARDGFAVVALAWIAMSVFGAFPFVISGDIPNYVDAFFETVSGFTTTGATVLTVVEDMSRSGLMWRSFTHWVGGMGVLVFVMAVVPMTDGHNMHLMRAEVPGPTSGKLVSRIGDSARILYGIYIGLSLILFLLLVVGGMPVFDALIHTFSTAGTGGFSNLSLSVGGYNSVYFEIVLGIFMLLFGTNFNLFYFVLMRRFRDILRAEEVRVYLLIVLVAMIGITVDILPLYGSVGTSLRHAFFQTSAIITTTGYATQDFGMWPTFSQSILITLMFTGACAGSTAGGLKIGRLVIMIKAVFADMKRMLHPNAVTAVRYEGRSLSEKEIRGTYQYISVYVCLYVISCLLLSLEHVDLVTTVTAVITCHNNAGPGLSLVGPAGNYSIFSAPAKMLLALNMLLGRLEIFPVLLLFSPSIWKRKHSSSSRMSGEF
jgi:trk system potassium uptake protein TrkH